MFVCDVGAVGVGLIESFLSGEGPSLLGLGVVGHGPDDFFSGFLCE